MTILACGCQCGSTESIIRNFLKATNYKDWMGIPIAKGKEKSLAMLNQLPPSDGKEMLKSFLKNASKWAIIVGYDEENCKWSDIAHNGPKSRIEAEFVVKMFSPFD